jgi:pSer/pThr/pTyr-binding forkhead associated (FHA) protein
MAVCPNGHESASDDFCDVCGMRIGSSQARPMNPANRVSPPAAGESCPRCGTIRIGQFCEACGFNFGSPGYTSARASFSPVGSPPRPTFTPINPDPDPEPAPPPAQQPPTQQPPAQQAPAQQALDQQAPAPLPPAPPVPEPSSPSRPSRPSGGGRHSAARPAFQSDPQSPPAPSYQSATQSPPAPSYQSGTQSPPAPSYQSGTQSPSAASSFPYPQATWTAAVGADRGYYEQVQAVTGPEGADVTFPSYYAERRFQLLGAQMRIGRRSVSRGLAPEIDLTGPPADPGISRLHAVLIAGPDGTWAVLDPGSANGTLLNGTEITIGTPVPLHDGDRINLGAWTSITVHRD